MVLSCQAVAFLCHLTPGAAQVVSDSTDQSDSIVANLAWVQSRFDNVREGYQSLEWSEIEGAKRYQVLDSEGISYYSGNQPQAFISGLPNGQHTFEAQAFSADEVLIGISGRPAVIVVHHWSMAQAWTSFGVGLVVFLAMVGVIVVGASRASRTVAQAEAES